MNCAEYLARFLRSRGVTHIFGLPGGENVPFLEAIRRSGIRFVLVHHEASAGFAADVTGQFTGIPGVCLSTVGPGAVNLLGTATAATLERSPVLAITADIDIGLRDKVSHMKVDLEGLFSQGTKASIRLSPDNIGESLVFAWQLAQTAPRGAVHLALSPETAILPVPGGKSNSLQKPQSQMQLPDTTGASFQRVEQLIKSAADVFILAGLGVEAAQAQGALLELADAWNVPLAVTPKAKGHFPETHPLYAGCYSAYGDEALYQSLKGVDLILSVGVDGVDLIRTTWDVETPLVSVVASAENDPVFNPIATVVGNLSESLARLRPLRAPDRNGPNRATLIRDEISKALETPYPVLPGSMKLNQLISALQQALPPEGVVTMDVGAFKLVFLQKWRADRPKSLFVSNGLSAMGYAIPGAIAIKLHQPDAQVVAVVGDGALLMYAGELATISRLGIPVVVLVISDNAYSLIRLKQIRNETTVFGTEFNAVDYRFLATGFGLDYYLIDDVDGAQNALEEALRRSTPALVEARVNKEEYEHFR
jgi:acetolactate synthase-1/2/3 large subunit